MGTAGPGTTLSIYKKLFYKKQYQYLLKFSGDLRYQDQICKILKDKKQIKKRSTYSKFVI